MTFVPNEDDRVVFGGKFGRFVVDFGDQRTRGVHIFKPAIFGRLDDRGRHAVGAENDPLALRHSVEVFNENDPAVAEIIDNVCIVHDFMVDV